MEFEKLIVFQKAVDFAVMAYGVCQTLPKGNADLADELRRSSQSIVLNIAEGAGEFAPAEKARFYRMARRSATESGGNLVLMSRAGLIAETVCREGLRMLDEIVAMLTKMIIDLERC